MINSDIPLELAKDDQVLLLQGFNDVLEPKRDVGKRFSSATENLKNRSPDQKHAHERVTVPFSLVGRRGSRAPP